MGWAGSASAAVEKGKTGNEAVVLYFCTEEVAKFAGEGSRAKLEYIKSNNGKQPKNTVFDLPMVLDALKKAGINTMAKIPATKENKDTFKKYKAGLGSMVVVAPDGSTLMAFHGANLKQSTVMKSLKGFKQNFEQWKKTQAKKSKK